MSSRYLIVIFMILPLYLLGKERIKIERIDDTNAFVTVDGEKIRLADVRTFSIHDADSLKRRFAQRLKDQAAEEILGSSKYYIVRHRSDSSAVYLWKKHLLLDEFINRKWLQDGLGFYEPEPNSDYTFKLKRASHIARTRHEGVYNRATYKERYPQTSSAVWLSAGTGLGGLSGSSIIHISGFATMRRRSNAWSIGYVGSGEEGLGVHSFMATGGFSTYGRWSEATMQFGLSHNTAFSSYRTYTRESHYEIEKKVTKRQKPIVAIAIVGQAMVHLPQVAGIGFTAVLNYYPSIRAAYFPGNFAAGIGLSVHLGWWNF